MTDFIAISRICAFLKGEVHSKMITSYLIVLALSGMGKVRGTCDKPFWIFKRLNNRATPAPDSDGVLVVASLACPTHRNASLPLKRHHCPAQLFNRLYIQNGLSHAHRIFTIRLGAPNTARYEVIIFG